MKVSSVSQMRALDKRAMEEFGIREELLMENAGEALYFVILKELGIAGKKFVVFCGGGNNGGDGFVVARKIHSSGGHVKVFVMGDKDRYGGAAKLNYDIVSRLPVEVCSVDAPGSIERDLAHCHAVVDAIFGTGLIRPVEGLYREVIHRINRSGKTVFSADIPSGVHGDGGDVMGLAVKADCTVTFGLPKTGNLLFPGYERCGRLFVTHISFPPSMAASDAMQVAINEPLPLPARDEGGHKGTFGEALFVAGASHYYGAPCFAALSFLKAGGGYARLAAPRSVISAIAARAPEVVYLPQAETQAGALSLKNKDALLSLAEAMDMVVVGPGVSLDGEAQALVRELVGAIEKPVLVDGDGLTALAGDLHRVKARKGETVLTPHLGEMSRLTGLSVGAIEKDRIGVVQRTAKELGAVVVLKGAHSLIGAPDERVFINMTGNSGMATAGSGDVLTGTVAAMLGLGLPCLEAVKKAVFLHGWAGDLAAEAKGADGMTAQDILECLALAVKKDREDAGAPRRAAWGGMEVV